MMLETHDPGATLPNPAHAAARGAGPPPAVAGEIPAEDAAGGRRARMRSALTRIAFWSVPALLLPALSAAESPIGFGRAFLAYGLPWYFWAAATGPIFAMARRFPLDAPSRSKMLAAHLGAGLLAGFVQGVLSALARTLFVVPDAESTLRSGLVDVAFWVPFGLLFYGATASIGFALDNQRRLRARDVAASRLHAQLVEAQLGALRMQLQPHFLFNALNAVSMLVRQGDSQMAVRMLARLSELLRHILEEGGEQETPLEHELELLARYLDIEQVRFGDRLRVSIDVPDDVRGALVPTFLLQPLVENAVRHGIAQRAAPGTIALTAARRGDALTLTLRNDGPPLPADWRLEHDAGIGLRNTAKRLEHLYGPAASISLATAAQGGVRAEVVLPFHNRPASP